MEHNTTNNDVNDLDMNDVIEGVAWLSQHLDRGVVLMLSRQAAQHAQRVRNEVAYQLTQKMAQLNEKIDTAVMLKRHHTDGVSYGPFEAAAFSVQQRWQGIEQCFAENDSIRHHAWLAFDASLQHLSLTATQVLRDKAEFHRGKFFSTTGRSRVIFTDLKHLLVQIKPQCLSMREHWVFDDHDDDHLSVRTVSCNSFGM